MLSKKRAVAGKIESVEGTAEAIAAAEAILCEGIQFSPNVASLLRNPHLTTLSRQKPVAGRAMASVTFRVMKYGGSAAGTAPFWGPFHRACGHGETIVASTSVSYKPVSSSIPSITLKVYLDGISVRLKGARGTVQEEMVAGEIPMFTYNFQGIFDPAVDVGAVTDEATLVGNAFPTFEPKPFKAAMLKIGGSYKAIVRQLRYDMGVQLSATPDANVTSYKRIDYVGRNATGEINVESVTKATYDFFNKLATKEAVQIDCFTGPEDSGVGTGTLNTMTDSTKNWPASKFAGGSWKVRDSAGATFAITASTATTLTVSGTPASGDYVIYESGRLIQTIMPKVTFETINDGDTGGIYDFGIPLLLNMNTGDDEIETKVL